MGSKQRIRLMNDKYSKTAVQGGGVKTNVKQAGPPISKGLLALFIFVVCGSAIFQIIQSIRWGF